MAHDDQPLGLTVHSLPSVREAVGADAVRTVRGRWKMAAVLLICAAPVIASYFTYYVVRPEGRRNFGELIEPQRTMPALNVASLEGKTEPLAALRGQWLLVSVAPAACDDACQKNLYLQRQMRESLGKDKDRIDWVWFVSDAAAVPPTLMPALKEAVVRRVDSAALAQWLVPAGGQALPDHLYVIDPQGNWMMRFPPHLDNAGAAKAKRDLERLLRASASWDKAGRTP
jgi:hypothetical protein